MNAVETFAVNNCDELTLVQEYRYEPVGEVGFGNMLEDWGNERTTLGLVKNHRNKFAVVANLDFRQGLDLGDKLKLEEEGANYRSKISTWKLIDVYPLSAGALGNMAKKVGQNEVQFYTLD